MKSTSSSFETVVELEGKEVEVEVLYRWAAGHPGKTYGDPDSCYPPEGDECEVEAIFRKDDPAKLEKDKTCIMDKLTTEQIETVFEQACNVGPEHADDAYEAAMEDKADAMREGD